MAVEKSTHKSKRVPADVKLATQRGGAREGSGRKPLAVTDADRRQVEAMSGYGVPVEQIAALTCGGISVDTLYKYFQQELVDGKAKANAKIGQTLFQKAMGGDTTAMIWWSKSQMRWKEKVELEHTGPGGGPIQSETTVVLDASEAYKRMLEGGR